MIVSKTPNSWVTVRFGDINTFAARSVDPSAYPAERFELYSVPTFPTGLPELLLGKEIGSTKQSVEPQDVLVCKINPRINRVWWVNKRGAYPQIASSEWIVMRAPNLCPGFLRHYFTSPSFRDLICDGVTGVGGSLTRAQPKRVAEFPVPIAPLAEQKRIAKKIDALFARVDLCREHLDRASNIIKHFRHSLLAAATSGELTREWREDRGLTKDWIDSRVEEIASVGTGSTPLRGNSDFYTDADAGIPWITSALTGLPFVTHADQFVTDAAIAAHRLRKYPVGTLLVAMYGEGKTRGQVTELRIEATVNQACAAISVDQSKATTAFVRLALEANYLQMRELAEGGNQPNLNLSKVKNFPLSLPPLDEQREIAERVAAFDDWLGRTKSNVEAAQSHVERLTHATLSKAFRGELVPQDLTDEPADKLLTRLARALPTADRTKVARKNAVRKVARAPKESALMTKSRQDNDVKDMPYLAKHLHALGGSASVEALFKASELPVADFYKQLAWEVAHGLVKDRQDTLEASDAA